ncbi:MAG: type I phosphomannose isomerase catalytic subunit, partial [bacterium]
MTTSPINSPILFEPILKRILWGGRRLQTILGKQLGPETDYAESWELADHPNGRSTAIWPPELVNISLPELVQDFPDEILGPAIAKKYNQFPLLIKFLDAQKDLSIQVHPDDDLARKLVNDNGKNEAWVVIHADPGSRIYAGLKPGVTREAFQAAMTSGTTPDLVHWFEPKPGDCIMIPAGTVHAIGSGVVLAEIQQMSDATFRVDDWGRLGPDGKPRQLHFNESMLATDFNRGPVGPVRPIPLNHHQNNEISHELLTHCDYFEITRWRFENKISVGNEEHQKFTIVIVMNGQIEIKPRSAGSLICK